MGFYFFRSVTKSLPVPKSETRFSLPYPPLLQALVSFSQHDIPFPLALCAVLPSPLACSFRYFLSDQAHLWASVPMTYTFLNILLLFITG